MVTRRVLLAGLPRSGTTWIAQALGRTAGTRYVHEPDNDRLHVDALRAKAALGRYPSLDPDEDAPGYRELWERAFTGAEPGGGRRARWAAKLLDDAGPADVDRVMSDPSARWPLRLRAATALRPGTAGDGPPHPGPVVVKSVHNGLALGWVGANVPVDAAAVVLRHPANVIGSWRDMGWGMRAFVWGRPDRLSRVLPGGVEGPGPGVPEPWITRAAWQFALLASSVLAAAEAHGWEVVDHGSLLDDPPARLGALAGRLGLDWTDEAAAWVAASDRPGEGYDLGRVAAVERERWRDRLDPHESDAVVEVLARFPALAGRWQLG